jgi:hypothetical protein
MVNSMNETALSRIFHRMTARPDAADTARLDADAVVRAADSVLSAGERDDVAHALSRSSSHSALVRMLRALNDDSVRLAAELQAVGHPGHAARRGHARDGRRAAGARRSGWKVADALAALAACLVAVVGVWSMHSSSLDQDTGAALAIQATRPDRIFTGSDEIFSATMGHSLASEDHARHPRGDRVFRSDFTGT